MTKILITGANGFFGRNLIRSWRNRHTLYGIDLPTHLSKNATREPYADYLSSIVAPCDITGHDLVPLMSQMTRSEIVIHLAAKTRITPSWNEQQSYYNTNLIGSLSAFEIAQGLGVKKFVYFSSSSVYGTNKNMSEYSAMNPTNPYAVSKMAAETALTVQANKGDTELIIVRPFTMYGDFMALGKYSLAISKFLEAWEKDEPLILEGTGSQSRDFVHADDAIQALELILEKAKHLDIFNIGTGTTASIKSIADFISDKQILGPARTGHIERTCADITRLTALGYKPKVDLFEWLTDELAKRTITKNI